MVPFYHEVPPEELFEICRHHLADIEEVLHGYKRWVRQKPDLLDGRLCPPIERLLQRRDTWRF